MDDASSKLEKKPKPAAPESEEAVVKVEKKKKKNGKKRKGAKKAAGNAGPKPRRPYPTVTFNEALTVAQRIKEFNGGNPWATEDVANALGIAPTTNKFFYVTAASRDFGLTVGTRDTATISLTDLGREIVYAPDPETEHRKKLEAFYSIEIFKRVLDHYKGSSLPEMKYLGNTLEREFGLAPEFHEEFSRLFRDNCKELEITGGGVADTAVTRTPTEPASRPATVTLGVPKGVEGKKKLKAFIIMPFGEKGPSPRPTGFFDEVLRSLLTPAGVSAGFTVETANRQGSDVIQSTIINDLLEADLVIADLTDHNPNVLFELGVRMAHDKPVALIKASGTGRIFDVDNMLRVYEYSSNLWQSTVEKDVPAIQDHVKGAWESRDSNLSYMKILRRQEKK